MSINNDFVLNRFKPRGRPDVGKGETLLAKDLNNQNSGDAPQAGLRTAHCTGAAGEGCWLLSLDSPHSQRGRRGGLGIDSSSRVDLKAQVWIDPLSLPQDLSREAILRKDGTIPSEWFHLPEVRMIQLLLFQKNESDGGPLFKVVKE